MPENIEFLIKSAFVVVGVGGILYSFYSVAMTNVAKSWIPISGNITSHWVDESRDSDGDYMYKANAEYMYEYRGRKHKGKRITVYVNPKSPKMSSVLCGIRRFHLANVIFFTVWNVIVFRALN